MTYNKDKMNTELKVVFRDVQELATLALDLEDNTVEGTQDAKMYKFMGSVTKLIETLEATKINLGGIIH